VSEASQQYLQSFRRYNYTTPKSYLELIALYKLLLARKRAELQAAKERLQNGVEKIAQASAQVIGSSRYLELVTRQQCLRVAIHTLYSHAAWVLLQVA
jgi:dynein heavy chain